MKNLKAPEFVSNLSEELRARHLLPVVGLLVVAILAVPLLIRGDSTPPGPQTELGAAMSQGDAVVQADPVVFAEVPVLRDFRERLAGSNARNPFKPGVKVPELGETESGGTGGTATDVTDTASTEVPTDTGGTDDGVDDGGDDGDDGGDDPVPTPVPPPEEDEDKLITYEIDVKVGVAGGELRKEKGVGALSFLPGDNTPVLQYITSDLDGTRASFVVSNSVSAAEGDGQCAPSPDACQFLFLEQGQEQRLTYDLDGETYRLKLLRIHRIETPLDEVSNFASSAYSTIVEG